MFSEQFGDFRQKYGLRNVLEGVFPHKHNMSREDHQTFLDRLAEVWTERYEATQVLKDLRKLIGSKSFFVLTTNGDEHLEAGKPR